MTLALLNNDGTVAACKLQGSEQVSNEVILELTQSTQDFIFESLPEKPVVSILRGFSAPVKLVMDQSLEELAFLLSYDSDTFNRWEAGQKLAGKIITGLIADYQNGQPMQVNPIIIDAFRKLLAHSWEDLSYFSLLLSLPSETYLAEQMEVVDVVAIHEAREFLLLTLVNELQAEFKTLYLNNHKDESGQFDAGAVGRRRIKNICLGYLARLDNADIQLWTEQQLTPPAT